jgi:hypothetical protein
MMHVPTGIAKRRLEQGSAPALRDGTIRSMSTGTIPGPVSRVREEIPRICTSSSGEFNRFDDSDGGREQRLVSSAVFARLGG